MNIEGKSTHEILETGFQALSAAETIAELTALRCLANAVRSMAKGPDSTLDVRNRAAELRIRAERKLGRLLSSLPLHGGDRKSDRRNTVPTLSQLGVSQNESKQWQKRALIPESDMVRYFCHANDASQEITAAGLRRFARSTTVAQRRKARTPSCSGEPATNRSAPCSAAPDESKSPNALHENDGDDFASLCRARQAELFAELKNHCGTLDGLLRPLCDGQQECLLSGQRKAIRNYLAEIEHLLHVIPEQI